MHLSPRRFEGGDDHLLNPVPVRVRAKRELLIHLQFNSQIAIPGEFPAQPRDQPVRFAEIRLVAVNGQSRFGGFDG